MNKFSMNKRIITLFIFVSFSVRAFPAELTLEDIRRAAVLSSPALKKLDISKQNQALTKISSYFKYIPSLSAGVSASYPFLESSATQTDALEKLSASARLSISESITIFDGGKSRIEKSNLALDDSSLDADTAARLFAVIEEADTRYFSYLEAIAAVSAAEIQMEISALALETAEIRRSSGILSQSDYFLALSDKSAADNSLITALTGLSLAKSRLEHSTGLSNLDGLSALNFDDYEDLLNRISQWTMEDISVLYEKIKADIGSRSPSLKSAYISLKRAENSYALSKSAFYPTLDLSVAFDTGYTFTETASRDPFSYGASVTLSGKIPLDYWVMLNNTQRQKNSLESARIDYEDTLASFDIELQSALFTIAGNARSIISTRQQTEYSSLLLEQQQELFRLSSTSMASFLDASSRAQSSESRKIQAEYTFLRSLSALKAMGAFDDAELLRLLAE
jgi:outer membrane protein TolC